MLSIVFVVLCVIAAVVLCAYSVLFVIVVVVGVAVCLSRFCVC